MTETAQLALIAALPATLAALAALVVGVLNNISSKDNKRIGQETSAKTDTLVEKTAEIHTLTNSNLSKITETLRVANEKIAGMAEQIANFTAAKAVADNLALAQSKPPAASGITDVKVVNTPADPAITKIVKP